MVVSGEVLLVVVQASGGIEPGTFMLSCSRIRAVKGMFGKKRNLRDPLNVVTIESPPIATLMSSFSRTNPYDLSSLLGCMLQASDAFCCISVMPKKRAAVLGATSRPAAKSASWSCSSDSPSSSTHRPTLTTLAGKPARLQQIALRGAALGRETAAATPSAMLRRSLSSGHGSVALGSTYSKTNSGAGIGHSTPLKG